MGTPRAASEIQGDAASVLECKGKVITIDGKDVTKEFIYGAEESLKIANESGVSVAILKSKSPSCGIGEIYDGSFTCSNKKGDGLFSYLCNSY